MKKLLFLLFTSLLLNFTYAQQTINMCDDEKRTFTYTTFSSEPGTYYWYIDGQSVSNTSSSITINWNLYEIGYHNIEVQFEGIFGCNIQSQLFSVETKECENSYMYAPNAFTPDGDVHNNEWKPIGWNWKEIHYTIFNRWGEIIFESYDGNVGWNGKYAGTYDCQDGVYVYKLIWVDAQDRTQITHGHITLLR
jgi:gliding motility-associated-like protein